MPDTLGIRKYPSMYTVNYQCEDTPVCAPWAKVTPLLLHEATNEMIQQRVRLVSNNQIARSPESSQGIQTCAADDRWPTAKKQANTRSKGRDPQLQADAMLWLRPSHIQHIHCGGGSTRNGGGIISYYCCGTALQTFVTSPPGLTYEMHILGPSRCVLLRVVGDRLL